MNHFHVLNQEVVMSPTFKQLPASNREQAPVAPTLTERRAEQRRLAYCIAFIRPHDVPDAGYGPANVWDVSAGGIGLFLDHPLRLKEALDVSFRHLAIRDRVATVVHVTELDAGWHIGCKLSEPFSVIELRALGAFGM
jgi:hypothetical protein